MRLQFDEQLNLLNRELTEMGTFCEEGIKEVASMLYGSKSPSLNKLKDLNISARQLKREIENQCIKLFLQQQPVAKDLRQISAALKLVTDLERISEQTLDIGKIILHSESEAIIKYNAIDKMADATINMVKNSIDAYVKHDGVKADKVVESDDIVDDEFDYIKKDLIRVISTEPDLGESALDLLMIAKYLEGIGDHAVNVALWVKFAITGILPEDN